jgi:glutamyl-Q tRNA(Asp) synthetase
VLRFAPSPNGYLHLGHAYSALLNADLTRRLSGRLLLRIEDIDLERCRVHFAEAILADLAWLGIVFDGPVRRQSEHFADYQRALGILKGRGVVYPCFCSRSAIAAAVGAAEARGERCPRDPDGSSLYPGTCRTLPTAEAAARVAKGEGHAWRLDMGKAMGALGGADLPFIRFGPDMAETAGAVEPGQWGDVILARKDVPTSYHLSVVVDDALQGVTHVVRGQDLAEATAVHRLLQALLGLPVPRYHHHGLIRDDAGAKLSKSLRSSALRDLRAAGISPAEIRRSLGVG